MKKIVFLALLLFTTLVTMAAHPPGVSTTDNQNPLNYNTLPASPAQAYSMDLGSIITLNSIDVEPTMPLQAYIVGKCESAVNTWQFAVASPHLKTYTIGWTMQSEPTSSNSNLLTDNRCRLCGQFLCGCNHL